LITNSESGRKRAMLKSICAQSRKFFSKKTAWN
jgi:hypothetical protein